MDCQRNISLYFPVNSINKWYSNNETSRFYIKISVSKGSSVNLNIFHPALNMILISDILWNTQGLAIGSQGAIITPRPPPPPPVHFNFRMKQGLTVSVSNIKDIAFDGCSEIIWNRNFPIFNLCAKIFGQYPAASHFF